MKRQIGLTVLTAVVIAIIIWIASLIFTFPYIGWNFFIGLGLSVVLFFFNSSGGLMTKSSTLEASSGHKDYLNGNNNLKVNVGVVFYGSVLFTVICFLHMIILYLLY